MLCYGSWSRLICMGLSYFCSCCYWCCCHPPSYSLNSSRRWLVLTQNFCFCIVAVSSCLLLLGREHCNQPSPQAAGSGFPHLPAPWRGDHRICSKATWGCWPRGEAVGRDPLWKECVCSLIIVCVYLCMYVCTCVQHAQIWPFATLIYSKVSLLWTSLLRQWGGVGVKGRV